MRFDHDKNTGKPMKTIFLSGSREIGQLDDRIDARLQNMMQGGFSIVVGDASGADKAFQGFFA